MKLTQEVKGDVIILRPSGQLMGGPDADAVREAIPTLLREGYRKILIDLQDVSWVNSTGLGILISSHQAASRSGGQLRMMRASRRIDSIFNVTRLNTVFQIFADEEAALRSFQDREDAG